MLAVFLDEIVESVAMRNPAEQARVLGEWNGGERLNGKVALEGLGIGVEECVDEVEELHYPLVLTNVFVAFESISVRLAVTAAECHASRTLFGLND